MKSSRIIQNNPPCTEIQPLWWETIGIFSEIQLDILGTETLLEGF